MADIFSVEPPRWLQEMTASNDKGLLGGILGEIAGGGLVAASKVSDEAKETPGGMSFGDRATHWFKDLPESIAEAHLSVLDPMWKIKVQQGQLKIAETGLALKEMNQKIQLNAVKLRMQAEDTNEIPKWLAEHPTYESRRDAEWPSAKTPEWNNNLNQLRLRDSQSEQAKVAVAGVKAFTDRLSALSKDDPAAAAQVASAAQQYTAKGQTPPPAVTQALALAEEAAATRKQNVQAQQQLGIEQAVAEGAATGATVTRSIGPKGETVTIKGAPAKGHPLGEVISVEDPVSKTSLGHVIATGPNTGHFEKAESIAGPLNKSQSIQVYRAQASVIQSQLRNADMMPKSERPAFIKAKLSELDTLNKQLGVLGSGPVAVPAVTPGAAPAAKRRVRVAGPPGPDGKPLTGTVEEGDTLPAGWKLLP